MYLNDMLAEKKMTRYRLAKESGIPQTTIVDICSGKARIEKCSAETVYKIATVLGVPMESLIRGALLPKEQEPRRSSFEIYKSNVCHLVKDMGDLDFMIGTLESDEIRRLYERKWYPEALYLLAMVDYLCRVNGFPACTRYDDLRCRRLEKAVYPESAVLADAALDTDRYKEEALRLAIPEFARFNIIEGEVRDVC